MAEGKATYAVIAETTTPPKVVAIMKKVGNVEVIDRLVALGGDVTREAKPPQRGAVTIKAVKDQKTLEFLYESMKLTRLISKKEG